MLGEIKTSVENNIWKIVYPTGTIRYRVEFAGEGKDLYKLEKTFGEAQKVIAAHLKKHPVLVPLDPEAKRAASIKRSQTTKVPNTKFINEYVTRPGTYSIRIGLTTISFVINNLIYNMGSRSTRISSSIPVSHHSSVRDITQVIYTSYMQLRTTEIWTYVHYPTRENN